MNAKTPDRGQSLNSSALVVLSSEPKITGSEKHSILPCCLRTGVLGWMLFLFFSFVVFWPLVLICFPLPPNMPICYFFIFICHIFHRITLEIMTLQPKCDDVETAEGVAITVTGVAQVNHHTLWECLLSAQGRFSLHPLTSLSPWPTCLFPPRLPPVPPWDHGTIYMNEGELFCWLLFHTQHSNCDELDIQVNSKLTCHCWNKHTTLIPVFWVKFVFW